MQLHHEFVVPLGVDAAWEAFNDLERIAPAFPGATVTGFDGEQFTGTAKVKLGPISLQYTGTGRFTSRDAAGRRAVIEASGSDRRGNGTAGATITARLQEEGEGSTRVLLDTDLRITGRPAQFGRGVVQDVGGRILSQFAANLTGLLRTPVTSATTAGAADAAGPEQVLDAEVVPDAEVDDAEVDDAVVVDAVVVDAGVVDEAPPARGSGGAGSGREPEQLDLGQAVGPALLQRYGVTVVAVVVTAVVTWVLARRRGD